MIDVLFGRILAFISFMNMSSPSNVPALACTLDPSLCRLLLRWNWQEHCAGHVKSDCRALLGSIPFDADGTRRECRILGQRVLRQIVFFWYFLVLSSYWPEFFRRTRKNNFLNLTNRNASTSGVDGEVDSIVSSARSSASPGEAIGEISAGMLDSMMRPGWDSGVQGSQQNAVLKKNRNRRRTWLFHVMFQKLSPNKCGV